MNATGSRVAQLVAVDETPDYPFGSDNALPGNYFLKFEVARWLTSDMYLHADPEVGYFHLNLIFKSQLARPIGTIPADFDGQVAVLDGKVTAQRWRALLRLDPSPLRHWRPYRVEGGGIRLGHPVVIQMIEAQLSRREAAAERAVGDALRKQRERLRAALAERGVHAAVLRDQTLIERMDGWLTENCPGRRTVDVYDRVLVVAAQQRWFANP
jgi:hypothetical protein